MMHVPRLPSYGMSFDEFGRLPVWLTDELNELLTEERDATIDALKGKKPLQALGNIPRKRVGATHFE